MSTSAFLRAFKWLKFKKCKTSDLEAGFTKIAIFVDENLRPTHAARQLSTGLWTSKLGELEDISHNLYELEGTRYGSVAMIMKRKSTEGRKGKERARGSKVVRAP